MRFRKNLGDLTELKNSIKEIGLIHPIVIDTKGVLIAGKRRLQACKELGLEPVYRTVDFSNPLKAEIDENTQRKDFSPSEIVEINMYYNKKLSKQSQGRPKNGKKEVGTNCTNLIKKQPRDIVSDVTGVGTMTLSKLNKIFNSNAEDLKKKVDEEKISVDKGYEELKKFERQEKRKADAELGKTIISTVDFRLGDFEVVLANIPDGSVDCIICDPPYPLEFIECWTKLSRFAKRVLKPNSFCIAYSGQYNLPEVLKRMSENLTYYWTFCLYLPGNTQIVNGVNIICRWKPVLIFQNGRQKLENTMQDYFVSDSPEKDSHDWQQSLSGIERLIEMFTKPGDLIVEPFAGAATTIIAAKNLGRSIIAAEICEETYNIAKTNINDSTKKI